MEEAKVAKMVDYYIIKGQDEISIGVCCEFYTRESKKRSIKQMQPVKPNLKSNLRGVVL